MAAAPGRLMQLATSAAIAGAVLLIVMKAVAYFETKSVAILSSLADSGLDLLASTLNFLAVRYALTPADAEHRFGHGKAEPLSGLGQAAFVAGSAVLVIVEAISHMHSPQPVEQGGIGIMVMLLATAVTVSLVALQKIVIKRTGSMAIAADSLHYTGDLVMNVGVIATLFLSARADFAWIDPAFGLGAGVFMVVSAIHIAVRSVGSLMDHELPDADRAQILAIARQHPQVRHVHDLRTRSSGLQKFIQMHLVLDRTLSFIEAHGVSDDVEKAIESAYPGADIIIHQDPEGVAEFHPPVGSAMSQ
jgi:ferrous-iron efflux pump FieF